MTEPVRHAFPSGTQEQFNLRLPDGMRDRIRTAADLNGRSMNAEIVATLEEKYPTTPIEVKAVDGVIAYIIGAPDKAARTARLQEVNARFAAMGSLLRVEDHGGALVIVTEG